MAKFEDVITEVEILVVDDSEEIIDAIPRLINEALVELSESALVPELKRIGHFTTQIDQAWATMPAGFTGKLLFVGNDSKSLAIADGGVVQLMEDSPLLDESGPVHTVALEGNTIYYQGIPTEATTFPLLYMVYPEPLISGGDEIPAFIPPHLSISALAHNAAAKCFNMIEDGVEGEKVNTNAQLFLHNGYANQFKEFYAKRRTAAARSIWSN